jgi:hypothetical protein
MPYRDSKIEGGRVRLKTSPIAGETIGPAGLSTGELALNSADGVLYYKTAGGEVGEVAGGFDDAPEDGTTYGRKDAAWVDITSPANLQVSRGNAAEVAGYTPLDGEPIWDNTNDLLYVGNGETPGGVLVGSPQKVAYQSTAAMIPSAPETYTNATPLTLAPQNSVWEITYIAKLEAGDFGDNASYSVKVGGFTGLSAIDGVMEYTDSDGAVARSLIQNNTESFAIGEGAPAVLRVSGLLRVTSASGTLAIGLNGSDTDVSSPLVRSALVARRIL